MPLEHLERHDGRVLHQIAHDLAVEDLQTAVVAGVREQRVPALVVRDRPDGRRVEPQRLVRLGAQLEVVPEQALVVGADEQVVAAGVHVDAGDPLGAGLQDLDEFLLGEVVAADGVAGGDEEDGLAGVELRSLRDALQPAEGELRQVLGDGVDGDGAGLAPGGDGGEVVAAAVPGERFDGAADLDLD